MLNAELGSMNSILAISRSLFVSAALIWEEVGEPREKPRRHRESMRTSHRSGPVLGIEPATFMLEGNSTDHCATSF